MLAEGHLSGPVVFCTSTGNYIGRGNSIKKTYAPLLKAAKVPYRKFHTFRHTHVSELLKAGESVVSVARRVGDSPEVILRTYAHYLPGSGPRIARRVEELYG
jgi:integrase